MFISVGGPIIRINTIVLILVILNVIPLLITKKHWIIFLYVGFNILIAIFFLINLQKEFNLSNGSFIDSLVNISLALIFTGTVGYQILKLHAKILQRVEKDFEQIIKTEHELVESELRYRNLFENAQVGIYQTTPQGKILKANPALLEMLGFDSIVELNKRNLEKEQVFVNTSRKDFKNTIEKTGFVKDYESIWKSRDNKDIVLRENSRVVRNLKGKVNYYEGFVVNITKRKKAELALKESEEKYRLLMENMNDIVMLVDNEDKVQYVNKRFTEKLGYKDSEILGQIGYEKLIERSQQQKIIEANKARTKNQINQYEATFIAKDGTKFDFLVSGAPVKNDKGEVIGSIGNMVDITDRKIAEEQLRKSQQLFQTLAMVSPVGIFRTRADGYTTYVNPKWMEISGLSMEEAEGDGWLSAVHPDDKKLLKANWKLKSNTGDESIAEYRFVKKDGSVAWVLGNAVPEIIDGEVQGFIGTITDITERKIIEKKIKESEARYRTIIEAFPDIIMISDLNKNIIFANKKLQEVTGITPEDYNNPDRKPRIHPDDMPIVQNAIEKLLSAKETHTGIIENRFIDAQGNIHWFSGIISKIYYDNQLVLQTITRDVTEKKKIEQELAKYREHLEFLVKERTEELETANEELISTNEELHSQREELQITLKNLQKTQKQLIQSEKMASIGVLAAGVAHEINNPLNFIKGGVVGIEDYFSENLVEHKEEISPLIEGINIGINRTANIVKSLNHYSRKNDTKLVDCDMHTIVDNCIVMLQNQTKNRIEVQKVYTEKEHVITGNEGKLHQVVINVLTNAIQSIEGKGTITIKTQNSGEKVLMRIKDNGQGIPKDIISKVFDPFFTTKDPGKGTGLGLSICYSIIEEHNGTIDIKSKVGKGTEVVIQLPIKK